LFGTILNSNTEMEDTGTSGLILDPLSNQKGKEMSSETSIGVPFTVMVCAIVVAPIKRAIMYVIFFILVYVEFYDT